jgi:hypothetical protein
LLAGEPVIRRADDQPATVIFVPEDDECRQLNM